MEAPNNISIRKACDRLRDAGFHMSEKKLMQGLITGVYPFGDYIAADGVNLKHDCYDIYPSVLERWIKERA